METALCVIDMQYEFMSTHDVVNEVGKEIDKAKRLNQHIIFVEYGGLRHDLTLSYLSDKVRDYNNKSYCVKYWDNGGHKLSNHLRRLNLSIEKLKVCGVNACYCVYETIMAFKEIEPFIFIQPIDKAIGCDLSNHDKEDCANKILDMSE